MMKSGMLYFGGVTVFMLLVVGVAMTASGGFQMLQKEFGLMGVVGFSALFVLLSVGFMMMVRRSLKRAMEQAKQSGEPGETDSL
ncbi:MAG: hypothetical protein JXA21_02630 [Anaerolineae bacterium]|nr:hypothetical protein [Anaerolineae bacterium]